NACSRPRRDFNVFRAPRVLCLALSNRTPIMRILLTTLSTAAAIAFAAPALADQSGRYQLEPSGEGFVRMDTETGAISFCTQKDGSLTCRLAEDGRTGAGEIDRMAKRIEALEKLVDERAHGSEQHSGNYEADVILITC